LSIRFKKAWTSDACDGKDLAENLQVDWPLEQQPQYCGPDATTKRLIKHFQPKQPVHLRVGVS
jgi:hypothetical protein